MDRLLRNPLTMFYPQNSFNTFVVKQGQYWRIRATLSSAGLRSRIEFLKEAIPAGSQKRRRIINSDSLSSDGEQTEQIQEVGQSSSPPSEKLCRQLFRKQVTQNDSPSLRIAILNDGRLYFSVSHQPTPLSPQGKVFRRQQQESRSFL